MNMETYFKAVEWISYNDEPTIHDLEQVMEFLTVCLVADLTGFLPVAVARDVISHRKKIKL